MSRSEGSLTVELVVVAPVVAALGLLGLGLGRYELVRGQILDAAHAGAQAASVAQGPGQAGADASAAVAPVLESDSRACPNPTVSTDLGDYRRGGSVSVRVSCAVPMRDLTMLIPGTLDVSASSSVAVDEYRSIG